ncbi:MAG: hypothetical protein JXB17_07290, partial [Bacteroidales bacterium]|nr:hypothetical protein [Bacteroidales bacterium]
MRKIFTLPLLLIIFNSALGQVSIPQNINATYSDGQIIIQWDPNPESNLHKYNIYRDTLSAPILLYDSVVNPSLDTFFIDTDITKEKTYYYRITAYDSTDDESGYSDGITVFYSFIPVINNINLWTSQYGNEYGDGDKGVFMQIQVSDPQGLSDIKSVTVTYPDETTYNLNDNGQNGDNNPNDGEYSYHDWSIYGSPLLGAYTFTVIDNSDNSITKTDTLDSFIDYPHNLYPRGNVVITSGTPTLSWDSVPGAASYSIWFGDKNGNHIWGPGNIDTNSIVYNFDASGPALVDGEYYIWHVNAYLNDASSNHNDVRFFYSSETDSPVVANPHIRSRHYGDDEGYEEYGLVLEIDVGDPQGLDDIQSVTVSSPEAEVYILYDDGHHSDWYENDGRFAHHFGGLTDSPPTGDYIYTITDNSSNTVIVTDNLSMVIDYPRNLSPAYNEVVTDSTPLFTWDSIDNINHYWIRVREYEGNTVWGWIDIYDTTITYNEDNNGSDLIDGGIYQWDISTGLDDAESWHHGVRFAYSSIPDIPILSNYDIDARQTIDYYNNEDYYYHFWIDVLDPQGLEEIDSVWIEFPDGSINLLYDDNTHCDGNAGDGRYQYCSGISSPVQTGIYTFYSKDKSGNLASKSDSIPVTLNCTNILSPANNSYINEPDFLIEWEKVTEATRYSISVYRHNWGDVWNYNIDSSITSINYSGENLIEGEIYSLYLHAYSLNNWSRTEIRFTYSEQGLITIDGIKDPVWDAATGHIHIDNSFLVDGNSEGDNDCSADVYLVYDSLFLYGFVEVTDDIMGDRNDWWWENDAFKMIFDTDPNTLASIQNANDRINIEFTARVDADDRRHGRNPCLFYRGETANGYIIEFAVSAQALINTSPDPDEQIT